ncbi:MAG: solute carrier family 23 protein [Sulfuritalea sp.]|nr:solute carrier family 23 protein [Sulfuritalea sp.]
MTTPRNRFDLPELAGAFGDLGTLIPFVVAYISLLRMDPAGILLAFGASLIAVGLLYKTPFPVQPMKVIGAAALTQTAGAVVLTPAMVGGAGLVTALIWMLLAATGLAKRLAQWIPKPALLGVVMGLGFSFMLEGLRMMATSWAISAALLAGTLVLLARSRLPAMLVLLLVGTLFRLFPASVLGVILFLAGAELAIGSRDPGAEKAERFVVLATAAVGILNVGVAVIFGFLAYHASKRGWLKI